MSKTGQTPIILLLADGFDEAAVSIILTTLRQVGLPISLTGLRSRRVRGAHGLVIMPNTSLDRVLEKSSPILALIIPNGAGHLARLRVDPRVRNLLHRCLAEQATLVSLGEQAVGLVVDLAESNGETLNIIQPEAGMYLEDFAAILAQQLTGLAEG